MNDFAFSMPTEVYFGKDKEKMTGQLIKADKVLFVYGSGSIKKTGVYDKIVNSLKEKGINFTELGGVKSNPRLGLVNQGIEVCRKENIKFILAVGGGSVMDTAKAISIGVPYHGDVWDFYSGKAKIEAALPVGVVLTVPATASETNGYSVLTNEEGMYKRGLKSDYMKPVFAILNPELAFSLPEYYMAASVVDIFAHVWERYFTKFEHSELMDRMCEGVFKTLISKGPDAVFKRDYDSVSEIMWASSIAHNDTLGALGDFGSHRTGHEISAEYDLSHGGSLGITMCAWAKYVYKEDINRFCRFAVHVWGVEYDFDHPERTAMEGIKRMERFILDLGIPTTFNGADMPTDGFEKMAERAVDNGLGYVGGGFKKLYKEDIIKIYKLAE